ncbi:MAG: ferrous iron transport protein B [Christensenellaceae bacterium]|jgi:ferrous iron transport protein B
MIIALAGNQNAGKTTLFNQLTGSNQHVGNFPGVTVERKEGIIKNHPHMTIVDLPGIYSLSPYSPEELVSRDFLLDAKPDAIINIVDATNIERNLYLTLQLIELGIPMVLALNMMDEIRTNHGSIDTKKMEEDLGIPCIPISAIKNEGVSALVDAVETVATKKTAPKRIDFCSGPMHQAIHSLAHLVEDHADLAGIPSRFAATKLVEGDVPTLERLHLNENELDIVDHIVKEMESELGTDREAAMADMRYAFIESIARDTVVKPEQSKEQLRSRKIDGILTHRIWAYPIFIAIMALVFYITFGPLGSFLSDGAADLITWLGELLNTWLVRVDVHPLLRSLVMDGLVEGVGSVLSFLPTIIILFFLLSILEDSGYMARIAFIMDKPLRKLGLSGRSFVPMLLGFGCSVPAILATRTLPSERDRKMTIILVPFMSCNAKLPIYSVFAAAFFPKHRALVMIGLYVFGILAGVFSAFLMKKTIFKGNPVPFIMELPAYRIPSAKSVILRMWENAKEFATRAFGIILLASIVIWVLQEFDFRFYVAENKEYSMLASIGTLLVPLFKPLGFGNWRATSALLPGLTAKETVVSTFSILTDSSLEALPAALQSIFSPLSAISFLVFVLLYTPCVAAISAIRQELGTRRATFATILFQIGIAWVMAFLVYQAGFLLGLG